MTHAEALAATIPMKPPVPKAPGIDCGRQAGALILSRRWLRTKHYFLGAFAVVACAWVGSQWAQSEEMTGLLVFATLFCISLAFNVAGTFVNRTTIVVGATKVDVRHGPLPSAFGIKRSVMRSDVQRFAVEARGALFAIVAVMRDGSKSTLVAPLLSLAQARFVEYQMAHEWGLPTAVEPQEDEKLEKSAATGAFLALLVPLFAVGVLLFFAQLTTSEVAGSLRVSGDGSGFEFSPTSCEAGQREGFSGVSLLSESSDKTVRIVSDPIKGKVLVVSEPGRANRVYDGHSCKTFELNTVRTDTNVNEIWLVDGTVRLDCPELRGELSFSSCQ